MPKSRERLLRLSATSHAPTDQAQGPALALPLPRCRRTVPTPLEPGLTARPPPVITACARQLARLQERTARLSEPGCSVCCEAVGNAADRGVLEVSVRPDGRQVSSDGPRHAPQGASCRPWGERRIGPQRRAPATSRLMAATGRVGPPSALAGGEVTANHPGRWIGAKACSEVSGRHEQGCAAPHARREIAAYASVGLQRSDAGREVTVKPVTRWVRNVWASDGRQLVLHGQRMCIHRNYLQG
jgi:hypothetical protein